MGFFPERMTHITIRPSSAESLSSVKFSFNRLLKNHWANFNQTW